jgi:hypothetical protein
MDVFVRKQNLSYIPQWETNIPVGFTYIVCHEKSYIKGTQSAMVFSLWYTKDGCQ